VNRGQRSRRTHLSRGTQYGVLAGLTTSPPADALGPEPRRSRPGETVPAAPIVLNGMVFVATPAATPGAQWPDVTGSTRRTGQDSSGRHSPLPRQAGDQALGSPRPSPPWRPAAGASRPRAITGLRPVTQLFSHPVHLDPLRPRATRPRLSRPATAARAPTPTPALSWTLDPRPGPFRPPSPIRARLPRLWTSRPRLLYNPPSAVPPGRRGPLKDGHVYGLDTAASNSSGRPPTNTRLTPTRPSPRGTRFSCPGTQGGAEWNGPTPLFAGHQPALRRRRSTGATRCRSRPGEVQAVHIPCKEPWSGIRRTKAHAFGKPTAAATGAGWINAVDAASGKLSGAHCRSVAGALTPTAVGGLRGRHGRSTSTPWMRRPARWPGPRPPRGGLMAAGSSAYADRGFH